MDNFPYSEQLRLLGLDWADKNAAASLLEDQKTATMARWQSKHGDIPVNRAEQLVKKSSECQDYIERMVEARRQADIAKVLYDAKKAEGMEVQSIEATKRVELRMLGRE